MRKSWLFPGDNDEPYVSQRAGAYQPQSEKRRRWTKRLVILALILCVLSTLIFAQLASVIANKVSNIVLNRATGTVLVVLGVSILIVKYIV